MSLILEALLGSACCGLTLLVAGVLLAVAVGNWARHLGER